MTASPALLGATISGALLFGLVIALIGCLRAHWAESFKLGEDQSEKLWATLHWSLIPFMFFSGALVDAWGIQTVIWLGSLMLTLSLFVLGFLTEFKGIRWTLVLAAGGVALLGCGTVVAMPSALFGQHQASAAMNLGTGMFVLGALLAPTLCDVLLRGFGYRKMLVALSFVCLIPAILAIGFPDTKQAFLSNGSGDGVLGPVVLAAAGIFFFYAPIEGTLTRWAPACFKDLGHDKTGARTLISSFWTVFFVSRLLAALLLHSKVMQVISSEWEPWILMFCACMVLVVFGNLMGTAKRTAAGIGFLLLALVMGPILPTLFGMLYKEFYPHAGTAIGIMFALGSFGGVLLGPMVSADATRAQSSQRALALPFALGILMMIASLVFALLMGSS